MISFRAGAGSLGALAWRFPAPKKKGGGTILLLLLAAATDPDALLSPTPCFPLLPSRGQSAVEFLLEAQA